MAVTYRAFLGGHLIVPWPEYYPENCPPAGAEPDQLTVYRLVDNDPPTESDFIPQMVSQPHRTFPDPCQASGLSFYTEYEDAKKLFERYPKGFRDKKIARGLTPADCGVLKNTPSKTAPTHITYWMMSGHMIHHKFEVVPEGAEQ